MNKDVHGCNVQALYIFHVHVVPISWENIVKSEILGEISKCRIHFLPHYLLLVYILTIWMNKDVHGCNV